MNAIYRATGRFVVKIAVITVSDSCSAGVHTDKSGPLISELLAELAETAACRLTPDDAEKIEQALIECCDEIGADIVFTTGGTGLSPRDVTPEATKAVTDRDAPGFAEAVRAESLKHTPHAMLSRAYSGIRGQTLIINLPGSPKAVRESLAVLLPALPHAVQTLQGTQGRCGDETR